MQFAKLCEYFEKIDQTSKRLEKTELLREIIAECEVGEVRQAIYISLGELRPKFDKMEFNLAEKMAVRAVAQAMGMTGGQVAEKYKAVGDLGEVIQRISESANQRISKSIGEVYRELTIIAEESGQGSQERKVTRLSKLVRESSQIEAKYIVRMVLGKLRLGFADKTILDALSYAVGGDKTARQELENLYQMAPDVGELSELVKKEGIAGARAKIRIVLGRPIMPALAQRLPTAGEMITKMGKVVAEPKFDGTRVQIHYQKNGFSKTNEMTLFGEGEISRVRTFTRNLDENSAQFPELKEIGKQIKGSEVILDSEAVGYDPKTGKMLPFQMTITRKRKHGVGEASTEVPLKFFVFDILYADGKSLLGLPLWRRREIIFKTIKGDGPLVVDEAQVTEDPDELREYHIKKLAEGLEGVVVKQYEGKYIPGRQGFNWVKFKEEEGQQGKLLDTVDAVVMGYYRGKGKRTVFGIGAFLVGIVGANDRIMTIAKIGTGLTDAQFREIKTKLKQFEIRSPRIEILNKLEILNTKSGINYSVHESMVPDVWVEPKIVVEVAADEITISPTHSSGYALRFPRLVRLREDKGITGVTTLPEIKEILGIV